MSTRACATDHAGGDAPLRVTRDHLSWAIRRATARSVLLHWARLVGSTDRARCATGAGEKGPALLA